MLGSLLLQPDQGLAFKQISVSQVLRQANYEHPQTAVCWCMTKFILLEQVPRLSQGTFKYRALITIRIKAIKDGVLRPSERTCCKEMKNLTTGVGEGGPQGSVIERDVLVRASWQPRNSFR